MSLSGRNPSSITSIVSSSLVHSSSPAMPMYAFASALYATARQLSAPLSNLPFFPAPCSTFSLEKVSSPSPNSSLVSIVSG